LAAMNNAGTRRRSTTTRASMSATGFEPVASAL
jgi:hypothetical protein